ncbi:MAG: glycoside hydrolase family 3 C-terminal domain-containing protein [Chitinophagaceae bacterium]
MNRFFRNWVFVLFLLPPAVLRAQDYQSFPMWNTGLPVEVRVKDVVNRLTLEEKVLQMLNAAPAVPRLGIPAYDWWNEVLHGVARTPFKVTSYPQAIGMAATWDTSSLYRMADFSALEGRAIHNKAIELGRSNERYLGLTYWTPNINIFRDPRWGRGQETYGEDPFLTGMLAHAFVKGLQGDDPRYLKAAACAKHFAVHSGPEPSRHSDNFNPSPYDLWDTYLPAFKELVVGAKVAGVMCAYNAINKQPCCANDLLMNDILRKKWNFSGYVTSDCWAVDDFFRYHKTHKDATSSAVDAVLHGTDVECGQSVYKTLVDAVKNGLITEKQLDISLERLFTIRFRLGMFDPPSMVKYAQTPASALEAPEHGAHALKMARQSVVLLRNENRVLPLPKDLKKILVLGPNADNRVSVLGNYNGTPSKVVSVLEGIREKLGSSAEVIYEKAINYANDTLFVYNDMIGRYQIDGKNGVKAEFFRNEKLEGMPSYSSIIPEIDLYWNEGQSPAPGIPSTHFSARFTTYIRADRDEELNFEAEGDDGYRVFVNEKLRVDAWDRNRSGTKLFKLALKKGMEYKLMVECYQSEGNASVRLKPGRYQRTDMKALAGRASRADVVIFVGGISPQLEGEEMPVAVPGFKGGDRTSIQLPAVQTELLKALQGTGVPVIFVMMTGSALAIPWESEHIPAILNAWYGGQSAGTAVADVLFGDYNPAGRLPVTFYRNDSDLPSFMEYDMTGRTYRYFKGDALYPFGYGLSYTSFEYSNLLVSGPVKKNKEVSVSFRLRNSGAMDGEEVVQLYVSHPDVMGKAPLRALKGFRRIMLRAGESRSLTFTLTPEQLSLVSESDGTLYQPSGRVLISVGGGQPGVKNNTTSNVVQEVLKVED